MAAKWTRRRRILLHFPPNCGWLSHMEHTNKETYCPGPSRIMSFVSPGLPLHETALRRPLGHPK